MQALFLAIILATTAHFPLLVAHQKHQPLGILPVPRQVGQVSLAQVSFMDPYGGKCFNTFSIPRSRSFEADRTISLSLQGEKGEEGEEELNS